MDQRGRVCVSGLNEGTHAMRLTAYASIAVLAVAALTACGGAETSTTTTEPATTTTSVAAPAPQTVAAYELQEDDRRLTMLVRTDDTDELGAAFREVADRVLDTYPDGGYFVQVDCAVEGQSGRLGNGKIAVGNLGAAQTGLSAGQRTIEWLTGRTCRPGHIESTFNPDRPLDEQYALELCRGKVEDEYVADQRPVDLLEVDVTENAGLWTVTGTARGRSSGTDTALVAVTCTAHHNAAGLLMVELTQFDVQ